MSFDKHLGTPSPFQDKEHTPESSSCPFPVILFFLPLPSITTVLIFFHHRLVSSIPELYRNVLFSMGPFAQYIGFEIHPSIVYYFLRPNSISLCDHTAHLPNNGCLGCFQFLALKIKLLWISHTSLFVDTYLNFSWV